LTGWIFPCPTAVALKLSVNEQIATDVDPNVQLAVDEHTIELIVNDELRFSLGDKCAMEFYSGFQLSLE
jgi:hypothetical protein